MVASSASTPASASAPSSRFICPAPTVPLNAARRKAELLAEAAGVDLGPVLTLFAAWVLLGEAITLYQIAGLALVLLGVSRLSTGKRKTG